MAGLLKSPRLWKGIKTLSFVAGLVFFVYLVQKLGAREIASYLKAFGFNSIYILALGSIMTLFGVWAWVWILRVWGPAEFWPVLKVKLIGETINTLTPLGWGSGDPARVLLLNKQIPATQRAASVVIDRTLQNIATAIFVLIGTFLSFKMLALPRALKIGFPVGLALIVAACLLLYVRSHEGLFGFLIEGLRKLGFKKTFSESTLRHIRDTDAYISTFYKEKKGLFLLCLGFQLMVRLLGPVEIYLIALFIGHPIGMLESYLLASLTIVVNIVFVFVPGALGVLEGAFAGVFVLLHLDPAIGSSIQIIRRIRMLFWTLVGLLVWAQVQRKPGEAKLVELAEP